MRDIAVSVIRNSDGPRFRKETGAKLLCGPLAPKPYQGKCFEKLADKQHRIIDIPTAAGKSVIVMALATHDAMNGLKPIIVVPQRSIGHGFKNDHFILPSTGDDILWQTYELNFLIDNAALSVERVITYLENPMPRDPACAHLITTHQTISQVYALLRKQKRRRLLKKVSIIFDEGHHIRGYKYNPNGLGEMIRYVTKKSCSKVTVVTATNFRTDSLPIAPTDLAEFSSYGLPYDEYIKYKSIGSLGFQFRLFKEEPCVDAGAVARGFLNKDEKSIIYVPTTNHSFYDIYHYSKVHQEMKAQVVEEILTGISPRTKWVEDNHFWTGMVNGKKVRVVDLIDDESNRCAKVKHIHDTKECSKTGVDVIIAMGMFKEGSDYPLLQHAIVIEPRGSLGEVIQMFGRVMRDDVQVKKGRKYAKSHVSFTYLLSAPHENYERFNRYMNALVQAMLLVDVMEPILVAKNMKKSKKKKQHRDELTPTVPTLPELFGDPEIANGVYIDILEAIALNDEWGEISASERQEKMTELVQEQIDIYHVVVPEDVTVEDIANKAYAMLVRDTLPTGIRNDIIIDPELIYKHAPWSYLSKAMGKEFFKTYRELLEQHTGVAAAKKRTREIAAYKKKYGRYPPRSISLGAWRRKMILAFIGKGSYHWHPECLDLAIELGCPDMFDVIDHAEAMIQQMLGFIRDAAEYKKKHRRYPNGNTTLARWLSRMRMAKSRTTNNQRPWYSQYDKLAKKLGCPDMFDRPHAPKARMAKGLYWVRRIAKYKKKHGVYPSSIMKGEGGYLWRMRSAKKGTNSSAWFDEYENLAKKLGCPDMFSNLVIRTPEIKKQYALDRTKEAARYKKKHGFYPTNNKKGGPLGRWLGNARRAKEGIGDGHVWYSECEKLAKKLGCPDMFFRSGSFESRKKNALDRTREVARYKKKHKVYPPHRLLLGRWLSDIRRTKTKTRKTDHSSVWYPECEELAKKLGCPDMFDYRK